jgi:transposase-like protein
MEATHSAAAPTSVRRRVHSDEFKALAVEAVLSGKKKAAAVAREMGVSTGLVSGWLARAQGKAVRERMATKSAEAMRADDRSVATPKDARRQHSEEFRARAVNAVLKDKRPVVEVARELSLSEGHLYHWVRIAKGGGGANQKKSPPPATHEQKKVTLFKAKGARTWSAKLTFSDGSRKKIKTTFVNRQQALMSAAKLWGVLAREKGINPPLAGRIKAQRKPLDKTFGLDKPKGHALVAAPVQRPVLDDPRTDIRRANRARALVAVLEVVGDLSPDDSLFVLRAAAAVAGLGVQDLRTTVGTGGMGAGAGNGHARPDSWP